ncbi:N-acetyltransferase [Bailinhaonella thermotolerans]|uniref:N-acetyltransferase n=1 Tax=Bailinhaonella thermotolerans TaxID=1070861 RepID=A0A3A4B5P0_9ACTN|nr:N-acetyltransferase [Bailinhaonella thermotolerans]
MTADAVRRTAGLTVTPVETRADRAAFLGLPYRLHRGSARWVPPLRRDARALLSRSRNPFFEYGEVALFLARRGGEPVGRVAAVSNPRHTEFHGSPDGFFGLFECADDLLAADALLETAADWLRRRGLTSMSGPVNFSTNDECGMLVDGFDRRPAVLMPYNPPYYPLLLAECGFGAAMDLWAWEREVAEPADPRLARVAERLASHVRVRPVDMRDFDAEVARMRRIYNAAWESNWGFVPMTEREFSAQARRLRPVVRPELVLMAEADGEPVGFCLTLPDVNQALYAAGGRLTPRSALRMASAMRRIDGCRVVATGVLPEFRRRGVEAVMFLRTLEAARGLGYRTGEVSWILATNAAANSAASGIGCARSKTYRIFKRGI